MKSITNIKKVALVFFIATGVVTLGSSIFIANGLFLKQAEIINRISDIPFLLTGMIYASASLRLTLTSEEENHKTLDIILVSVIVLALAGLIAINLFLPDL